MACRMHPVPLDKSLVTQRDREPAPLFVFIPRADLMPDSPDQYEMAMHLKSRVQQVGARFLLTELEAGLALLDVADTSQHGTSNERRRALALEAYEVVTDRLARMGTGAVTLTDAEQETIYRLYQELATRLGR